MSPIQLIDIEDVIIPTEEVNRARGSYVKSRTGAHIPKSLDIQVGKIIAVDITISDEYSGTIDFRQLYREHKEEYDTSVIDAVRELVGGDFDVILFIRSGSFHISGGFSSLTARNFSVRQIIDSIVGAVVVVTKRLSEILQNFKPVVKEAFEIIDMANSLANVARQLWNFWMGIPSDGAGEIPEGPSCSSAIIEWVRALFHRRGYDYGYGYM